MSSKSTLRRHGAVNKRPAVLIADDIAKKAPDMAKQFIEVIDYRDLFNYLQPSERLRALHEKHYRTYASQSTRIVGVCDDLMREPELFIEMQKFLHDGNLEDVKWAYTNWEEECINKY